MEAARREDPQTSALLAPAYMSVLSLIERLHRQLLDVIKDGLERQNIREVTSVQALLLYNVGDQEFTIGELKRRGHYLGSNVSYNIKQLTQMGLIEQGRSDSDRRATLISLTKAGREVVGVVQSIFDKQLHMMHQVYGFTAETLEELSSKLFQLERFWGDQVRYQL